MQGSCFQDFELSATLSGDLAGRLAGVPAVRAELLEKPPAKRDDDVHPVLVRATSDTLSFPAGRTGSPPRTGALRTGARCSEGSHMELVSLAGVNFA